MRLDCLVLLGGLLLAGCAGHRPGPGTVPKPTPVTSDKRPPLIVNPTAAVHGKIVLLNPGTRYVIVSYPFGNIPAADRRLNVYRGGLKVAEIKMNNFRLDTNIVADIVAGECQVGDEVRED